MIADNDPEEQEKILKFSTLLTNAVIFHTTLDMMAVIRELIAEGWTITLEDLAVLSPYLTGRIQRFGVYATDEITLTPEPFDAHLELGLAVSGGGRTHYMRRRGPVWPVNDRKWNMPPMRES